MSKRGKVGVGKRFGTWCCRNGARWMPRLWCAFFLILFLVIGYWLGDSPSRPDCCGFSRATFRAGAKAAMMDPLMPLLPLPYSDLHEATNKCSQARHIRQYPWWNGKDDFYDAYYRHRLNQYLRAQKSRTPLPGPSIPLTVVGGRK